MLDFPRYPSNGNIHYMRTITVSDAAAGEIPPTATP
jgi:hypothetical protein